MNYGFLIAGIVMVAMGGIFFRIRSRMKSAEQKQGPIVWLVILCLALGSFGILYSGVIGTVHNNPTVPAFYLAEAVMTLAALAKLMLHFAKSSR